MRVGYVHAQYEVDYDCKRRQRDGVYRKGEGLSLGQGRRVSEKIEREIWLPVDTSDVVLPYITHDEGCLVRPIHQPL